MSALTLISEHGCFGGVQRFYKHDSREVRGPMKFSAYLPPQARMGKVPVLYYLSGLTCTEETFPIKAHAQQTAAELGLMLIAPDTSPREPRLPVCRARISQSASELAALAGLLLEPGPVPVQGVAMVNLLLADGLGPIYREASRDDLGAIVERAAHALSR